MSRVAEASARLTRISAALREAGDRDNLLALRRGLRAGAAPLVPAVKAAARDQLPHAGGLNELIAGRRVSVSNRLLGRTAAVVLKSTNARGNRQTDSGYVRHPYYGKWYANEPSQQIPQAAGWWTNTLARESPKVAGDLNAALDEVGARIGVL